MKIFATSPCFHAVIARSNRAEVFCTKLSFKISQNPYKNTHVGVSFLIKIEPKACNVIKKETLAKVFFCEFCESFKNSFFYRTPLIAAPE